MSKKLDFQDVIELFRNKGYILIEKEYISSRTKMRYLCKKHLDKETSVTVNNLKNGMGCPYCANNVKYNIDDVVKEFNKKEFILLENNYINRLTKMKCICKNHLEFVQHKSLDEIKNLS